MDLLIKKLFDVPVLKTVDKREFCLCIGAIFFFFLTSRWFQPFIKIFLPLDKANFE